MTPPADDDLQAAGSPMVKPPDRRTALQTLELSNFRAFPALRVELHPELTVLVAPNGFGKTALLDACALAWRHLVDSMRGAATSPGFERSDVRRARTAEGQMVEQLPVGLGAVGRLNGSAIAWRRELATPKGRTTYAEAHTLREAATTLLARLRAYADQRQAEPPELPVLAYYGTGRLWSAGRQTASRHRAAHRLDDQLDAYLDCLDPRSSFQAFATWFEQVSREAQRRAADGGPAAPRAQAYIEAVRAATDRLLRPTGWSRLDWSFVSERIVASHPGAGELPVDMLSDGVRNTIGLVADLAHRCVRLNPHHGAEAPRRTSGVVMIDEVDMHLHPGWQQQVVPALREAFPLVQFILSTHSPQVLSTVPRACIRVLDLGPEGATATEPTEQTEQTEGVPSPDVLAAVMHVDPAPDLPVRRQLHRYRALIQDRAHDTEEGRALRATLTAHFGPAHPEILDLDRLIRFRRALSSGAERRPS